MPSTIFSTFSGALTWEITIVFEVSSSTKFPIALTILVSELFMPLAISCSSISPSLDSHYWFNVKGVSNHSSWF